MLQVQYFIYISHIIIGTFNLENLNFVIINSSITLLSLFVRKNIYKERKNQNKVEAIYFSEN